MVENIDEHQCRSIRMGWKVHQNFFAPIMTNLEPAPKELLNFVVVIVKQLSKTLAEQVNVHVEKIV